MKNSPKKRIWTTPKASKLSELSDTEGKFLPTLPEGTYETSPGSFTPGGS